MVRAGNRKSEMADKSAEMRSAIGQDWHEVPYYAQADTAAWMAPFWGAGSPFLRMFQQLELSRVIELACGHGRHAARILDQVGEITLVDVVAANIEACRRRFAGRPNIHFILNAGHDLPGCADAGYSALFCYDAMVHFEMLDVIAYLREAQRVLRPGGRALLHVSNNMQNPGGFYQANRYWRNFGNLDVVRHVADRIGFETLDHCVMDWSDAPALDGLILLERR
jgi:SAM-dependent methyltransferase